MSRGVISVKTGDQQHVDQQLMRHVARVCDAVGAFVEYWGFKAIHGRVWTLLAVRDEPLQQTEIARLLGVSKSLISGAIAELSERGLVRRAAAERTAGYAAVIDVWPVIGEVLRVREWMLVETARIALEAAIEEVELAEATGQPSGWNVERMRALATMAESAQGLLRLLLALRSGRGLERFGGWLKRASELADRLRRMR